MSDSLRNKFVVGLADDEAGQRAYAAARHVTASATALTVQASQVVLGSATTAQLGFFGAAATNRPSASAITDTATMKTALQNLGLIG